MNHADSENMKISVPGNSTLKLIPIFPNAWVALICVDNFVYQKMQNFMENSKKKLSNVYLSTYS